MEIDRGITRYEVMPIPPVEAHTERFEAGPISIGVEYRLLDDAITAAYNANNSSQFAIVDRGVSLHVFGTTGEGESEYLRFDCFDEGPHYHYVSYAQSTNEMVYLDPVAHGDSLEWALACIRTRLPQMLARAGAHELASQVDLARVEGILPKVTEAAYRARFQHDDEAIHALALSEVTAHPSTPAITNPTDTPDTAEAAGTAEAAALSGGRS
jgi:hypothetical protein